MFILNWLTGGILKKLFDNPLTRALADKIGAGDRRKADAQAAKAKLEQARLSGKQQMSLKHAEWEAIMAEASKDSWKDEFVVITLGAVFWCVLLGAIHSAWTGDNRLLEGASVAIKNLDAMFTGYFKLGDLICAAFLASMGIKYFKR